MSVFSFSSNRTTVIKEISDTIVASANGGIEKLVRLFDIEGTPITTVMSTEYGYNFSFRNICNILRELLGINISDRIITAVLAFISVALLLIAFETQEKWKELLSYTLLLILIPSFSGGYVTLFLFIPFIEFLNNKADNKNLSKGSGMELFYALIMLLILTPWALPDVQRFSIDIQPGPLTGSFLLYFLCIFAFTLLMLIEGAACLAVKCRKAKNRR